MLTDRELLVLAAKAIGATEYGGPDDCRMPGVVLLGGAPMHYEGAGEFGFTWNPLTEDGDALRLAVKLKMAVVQDHYESMARVSTFRGREWNVRYSGDPLAATRRAIVLVAAEIGKAMPC